MLKNRIIPCLDVKNGRVVKGINFVDLIDAGDPVEQAKIYDDILYDSSKAMELYEKILLEHNGSIFTAEARKRYRTLRGDNLNLEQ